MVTCTFTDTGNVDTRLKTMKRVVIFAMHFPALISMFAIHKIEKNVRNILSDKVYQKPVFLPILVVLAPNIQDVLFLFIFFFRYLVQSMTKYRPRSQSFLVPDPIFHACN